MFSVEVTNFIVLGVTDEWVIWNRFLGKMRRKEAPKRFLGEL